MREKKMSDDKPIFHPWTNPEKMATYKKIKMAENEYFEYFPIYLY